MKATKSKDGNYYTTLRVDFRLSRDELVTLLAIHATTYGDVGEELSHKKFLEVVKKQLMYQGLDPLEFGANEDIEGALDWAQEQVDKHWKEA